MFRRPPRSTRTYTLVPYTTLCRSPVSHLTRGHTGQIAATATPPSGALRATIRVLTCHLLRPGGGISARTLPCLPAAKGVSHDRISRRPADRRQPVPRTLRAARRARLQIGRASCRERVCPYV